MKYPGKCIPLITHDCRHAPLCKNIRNTSQFISSKTRIKIRLIYTIVVLNFIWFIWGHQPRPENRGRRIIKMAVVTTLVSVCVYIQILTLFNTLAVGE